MANDVSKTKSVGNYGTIRIRLTQVSQNTSARTSLCRAEGHIKKSNSGSSADSTNNCHSVLSGDISKSAQTDFSIGSGDYDYHQMIQDEETKTHDANGNYTLDVTFKFGPTITSAFGSGGSVSASLSLTRIPTVPAQVGTPTGSFVAPQQVNLSWSAPTNNGSTILEYQVYYSQTNGISGGTEVSAGTSTSKSITGLTINDVWYFFVRARNADGWGAWSPVSSVTIPGVPGAISTRAVVWNSPRGMTVSWSAPASNGGAEIDKYLVRSSVTNDSNTGTSIDGLTNSPIAITGLANGTTYYIWLFAHNSQGWSPASAVLTLTIPDVPDTPSTAPVLTYTPPDTVSVAFAAPGNGGSAITSYDVQYADNSAFTGAVSANSASSPKAISGLSPGKTYWFRVRANNSQGSGAYGPASSVLVISGPKIYYDGEWHNTICYYKLNGVWRIAIPHVKVGGTWKVIGG